MHIFSLLLILLHILIYIIAGATPLPMYQKLIEYVKSGELSFKYVKAFNMDEYVGKRQIKNYLKFCMTYLIKKLDQYN